MSTNLAAVCSEERSLSCTRFERAVKRQRPLLDRGLVLLLEIKSLLLKMRQQCGVFIDSLKSPNEKSCVPVNTEANSVICEFSPLCAGCGVTEETVSCTLRGL